MKKLWILWISTLLLLCGCKKEVQLTKYSEQILDAGFDTFIQLIAYTEDQEAFDKYLDEVNSTFQYYNALFDRYQNYEGVNNVKTINDNAGKEAVKVDQELIDVLLQAKEYSDISDQHYNVTFGAVLEIWHNYREAATNGGEIAIPTMAELEQAAQHSGWDKIEIDTEAQTVYINDPLASIDLGSVAKGYAAEQCAKALEESGLKHAIINAGGNVRIIGDKVEGDFWSVGIQLPSNSETASLATVYIDKDKSFVTSGDYQRSYEYEGTRYHHIIDPQTLMPSSYMRSVTVITDDSGIADILSTTLFTMSYEEGAALLDDLRQKGLQVEAIWVFDDTTKIPKNVELHQSGQFQLVITDGMIDHIEFK